MVMNSYISTRTPILMQPNGRFLSADFDFKMGEGTEVYQSCSAILNGEMLVFGGTSEFAFRQVIISTLSCKNDFSFKISKVIGCELTRIGNLNIDFKIGTCGKFNFPEERVMMCFHLDGPNFCQRFILSKIYKNNLILIF